MAARISPRTGQILGVALIVAAAVLALVLFVFDDDAGDPGGNGDTGDETADGAGGTAPDTEDTVEPADPDDPLPDPTTLPGGLTLEPVARVPGATALSLVDGELRATDTDRGIRYTVDTDTGERSDPTPYGALSRLARSEPSPSGDVRWVADGSSVHRLDPASGEVLDTFALEAPGAVTAVTDEAVWLTVSGLPDGQGGHGGSPVSVIQRLDAATGEVQAVTLEDPVDVRFALGPDAAYVTVGRTLYRLDAGTAEVAAEAELDEPATALAVGEEVLAVVPGAEAHVARFDRSSLAPLDPLPLEAGPTADAALVEASAGDQLWILRPDDDAIDAVPLGAPGEDRGEPIRVAVPGPRRVVAADGGAWVLTSDGDGVLARIDASQGQS